MIDEIIAGDALDFDVAVVDTDGNQYKPADSWTMAMRLVPRTSGSAIDISSSAAANGVDFSVEVSSTTTADWAAGNYSAFALVTLSGKRKTVYMGQVVIKANPATASTYDVRSHAQKVLDDLKSALESYSTGGQGHVAEYQIGDRRMRFRNSGEIHVLIDKYQRLVADELAAERVAQGLGSGRKVFTRFST